MDVTTVKIHKKTKMAMDEIKQKNETYDDVIARLAVKAKKQNLVREMIAGYKNKANEDREILGEWEGTSGELE
ncbi:hypothetical protein HYV86_05590 [Candidatus Woesearchaeota archaeon]|nr:hypothetical protein [Candidatus Woesearchaeota archaeon]